MRIWVVLAIAVVTGLGAGCANQKESHTARTGVEQLLISSAVDQALDNVDFSALRGRDVFLDPKYLECVDKNYVLVSMRHRILHNGAKLLDKADAAEVVVEVTSGGVGTDGQELFIGIPEIPLAPPSPIAIPRLSLLTRNKLHGTAKLLVIAYDAKTRAPLGPNGLTLARSDQQNWNVLGAGPVQTGRVPSEIIAATGERDLSLTTAVHMANTAINGGIQQTGFKKNQ